VSDTALGLGKPLRSTATPHPVGLLLAHAVDPLQSYLAFNLLHLKFLYTTFRIFVPYGFVVLSQGLALLGYL
jgi:hypothetical protein